MKDTVITALIGLPLTCTVFGLFWLMFMYPWGLFPLLGIFIVALCWATGRVVRMMHGNKE